MAEAVLLGTARALPSVDQENTYLALVGEEHAVLIDCAGSPYRRLQQASLDPNHLDSVILTHFHPDHVYGLPALMLSLWLTGRQSPLEIHASADTSERTQALLALFHPEQWPAMFEIRYHVVAMEPGCAVLTSADFEITAAPVQHIVPTIGLRVINRISGAVLTYSADTEPCPNLRRLARGANLLIHEASGARKGHSSAAQAGLIAPRDPT
ncbi:MAG: MBL fold metallo-hydrolase [Chloroflexi bacterium HGW-Chloroflexi-1]|nr:MAG: MBL fold metallo-hydrolase [Chloroflexi bacterium HGW-Chloroflexi-1]